MAKNNASQSVPSDESDIEQTPQKVFNSETGKIDFDSLSGEAFVGLNLLDLAIGEADGPFILKEIRQEEIGKGKNKKMHDVYHAVKGSTPVQMPLAASFITKAVEADLSVGDTFYVKRANDYVAKEYAGQNCKAYLLKVTARATK